MRVSKLGAAGAVACLLMLGAKDLGRERNARSPISADEFVRAVAAQRASLIEFYLSEHLNPNARAAHNCPLILAAALQQDWDTAHRLLDAGASVDLADDSKFTPLMAAAMYGNLDALRAFVPLVTNIHATDQNGLSALHYALASRKTEAAELLLSVMPALETRDSVLLKTAIETANRKIIPAVLERLPLMQEWSIGASRALQAALDADDKDQIRLLLKKHAAPPAPEGKGAPLLAYAIAQDDAPLFTTLLECGADPNTALRPKQEKDFLAALPPKFRDYVTEDKDITVLMFAAGLGRTEYVRSLLQEGADKRRATGRYKMLALYFATELGNWQTAQVLLGSGPSPEQLRIEISLASQHVALIKDGVPVFNTVCSTGREGFATKRGDYVITDKDRDHWSSIYKVEMPYFMRLSCLDFGMHEGVVPDYPASHGCIRLPGEAARKFFAEIPIGTLVSVK